VNLECLSAPRFEPKEFGLACPHCHLRSMSATGHRIYVCINPDCPSQAKQVIGQSVCMLTIDPVRGAELRPWREVVARDRIRKTDPRGFLRRAGVLR